MKLLAAAGFPSESSDALHAHSPISRFTILLLSGVVVYTAAAGYLDRELICTLLGGGLVGVCAFLGCELAAARQSVRDERRLRQRMERRLKRHLDKGQRRNGQLLSHEQLEQALRSIQLG